MAYSIKVEVTGPRKRKTRVFSSVRAVARMLSGYGTQSGGLRSTIEDRAANGLLGGSNVVRNNKLVG